MHRTNRRGSRAALVAFTVLLLALGGAPALAQQPATNAKPASLAPGDAAPPISVTHWLAGEPLASIEKGRAALVLLWAPWSGASTQTFPRLADLARRNGPRGLDVVAIATPDARGSTLANARRRVLELATWATFPIGFDASGVTRERWLDASRSIPLAFLVDREGRVATFGALVDVEPRVEQVLAGAHDVARIAAEAAEKRKMLARSVELQHAFDAATRARDWPRAVASSDELLKLDAVRHRRYAIAKLQILLREARREDEAYAYAQELADGLGRDDVGLLNLIAWTIVDPAFTPAKRDTALAAKCAQRAVDLTQRRNAVLLDTLARVHRSIGDVARAIEVETEAARIDRVFEPTLASYRAETR